MLLFQNNAIISFDSVNGVYEFSSGKFEVIKKEIKSITRIECEEKEARNTTPDKIEQWSMSPPGQSDPQNVKVLVYTDSAQEFILNNFMLYRITNKDGVVYFAASNLFAAGFYFGKHCEKNRYCGEQTLESLTLGIFRLSDLYKWPRIPFQTVTIVD